MQKRQPTSSSSSQLTRNSQGDTNKQRTPSQADAKLIAVVKSSKKNNGWGELDADDDKMDYDNFGFSEPINVQLNNIKEKPAAEQVGVVTRSRATLSTEVQPEKQKYIPPALKNKNKSSIDSKPQLPLVSRVGPTAHQASVTPQSRPQNIQPKLQISERPQVRQSRSIARPPRPWRDDPPERSLIVPSGTGWQVEPSQTASSERSWRKSGSIERDKYGVPIQSAVIAQTKQIEQVQPVILKRPEQTIKKEVEEASKQLEQLSVDTEKQVKAKTPKKCYKKKRQTAKQQKVSDNQGTTSNLNEAGPLPGRLGTPRQRVQLVGQVSDLSSDQSKSTKKPSTKK